jgi:hypothetical protein
MRRVLPFVGLLAVAGLVAFAPAPRAFAGGGAERQDPLAVADQLEKDGRAQLEQGHKAEGAKLLSKAWAIRAEVFAHERGDQPKPHDGDGREKAKDRPELEALQARVLELKARSNDAERAGKELKANGHGDEAQAKMEESGKLWREAEELQRKLEAIRAQKADRPADSKGDGQDEERKNMLQMLERLRASVAEQRSELERQMAAGNETAARQAKVRVMQDTIRIGELEGKLRAMQGGEGPRPGGPREGGDAVAAVHQQLEKLMRRMNEMAEKLKGLERRLEKAESDD